MSLVLNNRNLISTLILFLTVSFSATVKAGGDTVRATYAETVFGNFIWVGNTNTNPADDKYLDATTDMDAEIINIRHIPAGYSMSDFTNINFNYFCVPFVDAACGKMVIPYAQLNWVYGNPLNDQPNDKVRVIITSENGLTIIKDTTVTAKTTKEIATSHLYSHHADISGCLNNLYQTEKLKVGEKYRIYVADIKVKLGAAPLKSNNGTGWSFAMVYSHPMLDRRSIMFYDVDKFAVTGFQGVPGEDLEFNLALKKGFKMVDEDLTIGYSGFGSMFRTDGDYMWSNEDVAVPLVHDTLSNKWKNVNVFRSSISYSYESCQITENGNMYTRAFDLNVAAVKASSYINAEDTAAAFNVLVTRENENHFFTSAVLAFGAPDVPEATMPIEVSDRELDPDKEYTCKMFVTVGDNKDGLTHVKLNIPISEYVDSISVFQVTFLDDAVDLKDKLTVRPCLSGNPASIGLSNFPNNSPTNISNFYKNTIDQVNAYLRDVTQKNDSLFEKNPSKMIQQLITLDFGDMVIPSSIKNKDVIEIKLTLHTKPADDNVYRIASYDGGSKPEFIQDAEMSVEGSTSKEQSTMESVNRDSMQRLGDVDKYFDLLRCKGNGKGNGEGDMPGGGGGGCDGVDGKPSHTTEGLFQKNRLTDSISITISASSKCVDVPDTVEIPFCSQMTITASSIHEFLYNYYKFDIDSIARLDSCIWERAKREKLLNFARDHGVNRSRMAALLSNIDKLPSITSSAAGDDADKFKRFLACEAELSPDSIDSIINMKIDYSKLFVLYQSRDTTDYYQSTKSYDVRSEEAYTKEYTINDDLTTYASFRSPWKNGGCDTTIVIKFIKSDLEAPVATYKDSIIKEGDTIYACREEPLKPITIFKDHNNYDIYADITDTSGTVHPKLWLNRNRKIDDPYSWNLSEDTIISNVDSGTYKIVLYKRNYIDRCFGEKLTFNLKIIDITINEKPHILNKVSANDVQVEYCQSIDSTDYVTLKVDTNNIPAGLDIKWFLIYDTIVANQTILKDKEIGEGDTVNIPSGKAGTFRYAAAFSKDICLSEKDTIFVRLNPYPDLVKLDTITICQNYELKDVDVLGRIKKLNPGFTEDSVLFYKYIPNSAPDSVQLSLTADSIKLSRFLYESRSNFSCNNMSNVDYRYTRYVAQAHSGNKCLGKGNLGVIEVICYEDSTPKFSQGDSLLYCTGDKPTENLNEYISNFNSVDRWVWMTDSTKLPKNGFEVNNFNNSNYIYNPYDPHLSTESPYSRDFFVVRVDSNNCVSDPAKFTVVVGDSIHSTPLIGDTTKYIYTNQNFILEFCPGDDKDYPNAVLPVKASESTYTMTAVEKNNFTEDCDTTYKYESIRLEWNKVKQDSIVMPIYAPGKYYYCIRQTTSVGCHGPWVNITISVRDSVKGDLSVDSIKLCEASPSAKVVDFVHNGSTYNIKYYDKDTTEINRDLAVVNTDVPGEYLSSYNNNLFFVSLFDTKCSGEKIPVQSIVSEKPSVPNILNDTLYYCLDDNVDLTADGGVTVNKPMEVLKWKSVDKFVASVASETDYLVQTLNSETGCLSDYDTIDVLVEKTFDFAPIAPIQVCYGETVDLWDLVEQAITPHNMVIKKAQPIFEIKNASGTKLTETAARNIVSTKAKTIEDEQTYYISVSEPISGCSYDGSVTINFAPLPEMQPDMVNKCEGEVFALPTPEGTPYSYEWYNKGSRIINETAFSATQDETLTLVATTSFNCVDSVSVVIDIDSLPGVPLISDTALCQGSGNHTLDVDYHSSVNSDNVYNDLHFYWEDKNKTQVSYFSADTSFADSRINVKYVGIIKNINKGTHCFNSKEITVTVNKRISLGISDPSPICQPQTFDATSYIKSYLNSNSIGGHNPKIDYYFKLDNNLNKTTLTEAEMNALEYSSSSDQVRYGYGMIDSDGICSSEDTFVVTINRQPKAPLIEQGEDSLFFCRDNAPLVVNASDTAGYDNLNLIWQNNATGLSFTLNEAASATQLSAYFQDTITSCKGDPSTAIAIVAAPIKVKPIGGKDTLAFCADSVVNLWDLAYQSFTPDLKDRSNVTMTAKRGAITVLQSQLEHLTSTVQDTATYEFEMSDDLTRCSATNKVTVIFHQLPHFSVVGETEICYGDSIGLKVTGDDRPIAYGWYYGSTLLSTGTSYKQSGLTTDTTLTVEGALNDLSTCKTVVTHFVQVDSLPAPLKDTSIYVCQDTTSTTPLKVNFDRSSSNINNYAIVWYNSDGDTLQNDIEDVLQPIVKDGVYVYRANLTDRNTGCVNQLATMKVNVQPQIGIHWIDPDTICQPDSFNLIEALAGKVYGGKNPSYQYAMSGTDTLHNETAIKENTKLTVYYKDINGCEMKQNISVQFHAEPNIPTISNDTDVCQALKTITLNAKANGLKNNTPSAQSFEWVINGHDTIKANSIVADLSSVGVNTYEVRAYDLKTFCYSKPDTFTMLIRDSIQALILDTLKSCYNVPVDLTANVEHLVGGKGKLDYQYQLPGSLEVFDPTAVVKSGTYVVKVSDSLNVCQREDKINVVLHDSLRISADGPKEVCEYSQITLHGLYADSYVWRREDGRKLASDSLVYASETAKTEVLRLIGTKQIGALACQDSIDVPILTNPNPKALPDSTIYFCQDTASASSTIQFDFNRTAENKNAYLINWYATKDAETSFSSKESVEQSIKEDSTFIYWADLTDRLTGCVSPRFKMTVIVHPMIRTKWQDPQPICEPFTYNLKEVLEDRNVIYGGTGALTHFTMNGSDTLSDETAIAKNSQLMAYFTDANGCKMKQEINILFHSEPNVPTVPKDTDICQSPKVIDLKAKSNGVKDGSPSPQIFEWILNDKETLLAKTKEVDLNKAGKYVYRIRAYDTVTRCYSQPDTMTLLVRDSIQALVLDTLKSCYMVPVDIKSKVEHLTGGKGTLTYEYSLPGSLETFDPSAVVKTGSYVVKVSDSMAVCQREEEVNVQMWDSLSILAVGPREVCEYSQITLKAKYAEKYVWRRADGRKLTSDSLVYSSDTAKTEVLRLIGTTQIGDLYCHDSIDVTIVTNPNPKVLNDSVIYACQDTNAASSTIKFDFNRSTDNKKDYSIAWYDKADATEPISTTETMEQSIKEDGTYNYWADLTNRLTGCVSSRFKMTIIVHPMIRTKWQDPQPICEPFTYNLKEVLEDRNVIYGGTGALTHYTMNGSDTLSDETAIAKNSQLVAYFTDEKGCQMKQDINVLFHSEPNVPTVPRDTDICQSQKVIELTVKSNGVKDGSPSPQIFEWILNDKETLLAESKEVDLNKAGKSIFRIRAYDTVTKCYSQEDTMTLVVRDSIQALVLDTLKSCYMVPVDVKSKVEHLTGGKGTLTYEYSLPGSLETFDPSAVVKTGSYVVKVSDSMAVCKREEKVNVQMWDSLSIVAEGPREVCEYSQITLKANNADSYVWRRADGRKLASDSLVYVSDTAKTEVLRLIGTSQIGALYCHDSIDVTIVTNPNPKVLNDSVIYVCQDTAANSSTIKFDFNRSTENKKSYSIAWYDKADAAEPIATTETMQQSIKEDGTYNYWADLTDKVTGCVSPRFKMTVEVHPMLRTKWRDPETICQPFTFNLEEALDTSIYGGEGLYDYYVMNGADTLREITAIADNSKLTAYYTDENGCQLTQKINVKFYVQPAIPTLVGDTIVCQNIGDIVLTAKKNGTSTSSQTFVWEGGEIRQQSDDLTLSTNNAGTTDYTIKAVDTLSHCYSEPLSFTMDIRKKLEFKPVGLLESCYNVGIDLPSKVEPNYSTNDDEITYTYSYISSTGSLTTVATPESVTKTGKYLVGVKETESKCERKDTIEVVVYDSIGVATEGTTTICYGDVVPDLKAINADSYVWRRGAITSDGANFPYADAVQETETFRLIGEKKIGSLYCQDSIDVTVTVLPNPQTLPDTIINLCQLKDGDDAKVLIPTRTNTDELLMLKWYDANNAEVFENMDMVNFPITEDGTTEYFVKQVNKVTGCESKLSSVKVIVYPQIQIALPDTASCQPYTIDLLQIAKQSATAKDMTSLIVTDAVYFGTTETNDVTANARTLSESGVYKVNYSYTINNLTCTASDLTTLTFYKQPVTPSVESQGFCQNTGDHLLEGMPSETNLRLIWENISSVPSVVDTVNSYVNTEIAGTRYYKVRHIQDYSNCLSLDTTIVVTIYPEVRPLTVQHDMCVGESITIFEIANTYNIKDTIKSLYNQTLGVAHPNLDKGISETGLYTFVAKNEHSCIATDTLNITFHQPENLQVAKKNIYCYGEIANFVATTDNPSTFEWYEYPYTTAHSNPDFRITTEVDRYKVIAKESSMGCAKELEFTVASREKIQIPLDENYGYCVADTTKLYLMDFTNVAWYYEGASSAGLNFKHHFDVGVHDVRVVVEDRYQCTDSMDIHVRVVDKPYPLIAHKNMDEFISDEFNTEEYAMNKDHRNVTLYVPNKEGQDSDLWSYQWTFSSQPLDSVGDRDVIYPEFSDDIFNYCNDVYVSLTATHEYGCSGTAVDTLRVYCEPDVPNSFLADGSSVFMEGYNLQIFDRVGTLIYHNEHFEGWNGTCTRGNSGGFYASNDTYFYVLTYYVHGTEKTKTGYVTVAREE